jgi:chaperonin cofactor prefoldin
MSAKQIKARLEKLSSKIKVHQTKLADLRTQAKDLKTQLATARETEKAKSAKSK